MELNCDLGELEDEPEELFAIATVANVACGGHAGGGELMRRTLERARAAGTRVVAHPSYADRAGFGRAPRFSPPEQTAMAVEAQCVRLAIEAKRFGFDIDTVKPHGALYHDASNDADYAGAVLDGASRALPGFRAIVGPPDTILQDIARVRGFVYEREGFVDRRYDQTTFRIVPRSRPDALLTEPESCISQALLLARMGKFDTLCMHGDTPGALAIGRAVRGALEAAGLLRPRSTRAGRTAG
jgi:UPF0271 protein